MILDPTDAVGSAAAAGPGAVDGGTSTKEQEDRFMAILLEQLKNQNPLNPMSYEKFVGQMAQLTTLQETSKLRNVFQEFTRTTRGNRFLSLIGREVQVRRKQADPVEGTVERVRFTDEDPNSWSGDSRSSIGRSWESD